ncbi:LytR C-terminal domain-containing protein [Corynebacterium mycetoides]|uniref:LytR C-terminal domain-containing protein n=1 Tax=Corynebacterium mycetoides TaxID=38302 RepID=UPI0012F87B51|nr:LytR C-terminal domain-containing protein [Corynebacterium mycetoides]
MSTVNPGNGNPDDYAGEVDEYRGSHRRDDENDAAGSTAAAAGGIPKRGLAMILIAVAAILLLWGLYALTQNDNDSANVTGPATSSAPAQGQNQQHGQQGQQGQQSPAPADNTSANQSENSAQNQAQDPAQNPAQPQNPAPAPNQGPALTRENAQVYVFNNSPNQGLAGATADRLSAEFTVENRTADSTSMNLPEQRYGIFPRTTVFFDPSVSGAEQVAADVARQVDGVATPVTDVPEGATLPDQVRGNREAISVVLAG